MVIESKFHKFTIGLAISFFYFGNLIVIAFISAMTNHNTDRAAAVAGRFYSSDPETLKNDLRNLFQKAEKFINNNFSHEEDIVGLIVPHAGYIFSGVVAAAAYSILLQKKEINRVFLIGSSHHASFHGASIYHRGNYHTPLGSVKVDKEMAEKLLENSSLFHFIPEIHTPEHTLEVQLPFLQYLFKDNFSIIPIIIGTMSHEVCGEIANSLKPFFTSENLFIISTDLSHYPEYNDAFKLDHNTISEVCSNNPSKFIEYLHETDKKNIPGLMTSMCGWTSVLTLLYLTFGNSLIQYNPILYQNSGDIPIYGEKHRVVGYQSIVITQKIQKKKELFKNHGNVCDESENIDINSTGKIEEKFIDPQLDGITA